MIVRRAGAPDALALARLRDIDESDVGRFVSWVTAHADTHLPFVAQVDGSVVAAAWLCLTPRIPDKMSLDRWSGDVQSVMVREEYRSRGIGGALMAAILAEARTRHLSHVTVQSGRRAVDFYLRSGFTHHRQNLIWEASSLTTPDPNTSNP